MKLMAHVWAVLVAALAVSGCGGGGGGDTAPAPGEANATLSANPGSSPGANNQALSARDAQASAGSRGAIESVYSEGGKLLRADPTIAALGPDLFGDRINLYNGALEFVQTDFSVPGHENLRMGVARRLVTGSAQGVTGAFGDWDLEIPRVQGVFSRVAGWTLPGTSTAEINQRCSHYDAPANVPDLTGRGIFTPAEYWHGNALYVPGQGAQEILGRMPNAPAPADGYSYGLTTKNYWVLRCIPLAVGAGEGFLAISPDGTRYTFDRMVKRNYSSLQRGSALPAAAPASSSAAAPADGNRASVPRPVGYLLNRSEVWILPSLIVDRYGNTLHYTYDSANPERLLSIEGSDPSGVARTVTFHYDSANAPGAISSASDGTRTWNYEYVAGRSSMRLSRVTRPDASSWTFNLDLLANADAMSAGPGACDGPAPFSAFPASGDITHPSGAQATFTLTPTHHGRSGVPRECHDLDVEGGWSRYPLYMDTWSVTNKTITGAGLTPMAWNYVYGDANASFADCTACPSTKTVTVTDARNVVSRHTFGNRYQLNEGQLLLLEEAITGGQSLRTTQYRYKLSPGPYADPVGYSRQERTMGDLGYRPTPQEGKLIQQQGRSFSWTAGDFDEFARATLVTRSSGATQTRTDRFVYSDNKNLWVLGQLLSATELSTNVVVEAHSYDPTTANRMASYSFGRQVSGFGYYPDGTLQFRADPIGRQTQFSHYKRGIAQTVLYADGTGESAEVDDAGQIRSVTNAVNGVTRYDYDAMGRLSLIRPPDEPGFTPYPTQQSFAQSGGVEYGLAPGHWVQVVTSGNARTERYFDAMWRPVMTRTWDVASEAATRRVVLRRFDPDNRSTFESYPLRELQTVDGGATAGVAGIEHRYDGLGRSSQVIQDSELGHKLTIATSYLGDFTRQVINPRGKVTTTSFQAFDTPSEESIVTIAAPESVRVVIDRDVFGKPRSITRGANSGQDAVTRSYVYDAYHRLCKTVEPESGATVQAYDGPGNVQWRASGLSLPGTGACDQGSVAESKKVQFSYDPRDRMLGTRYSDAPAGQPGLYDIARTYTADGLLETITTEGGTWTYGYGRRRILEREDMYFAGSHFIIQWGINAAGHVGSVSLPWTGGPQLNFAPNALGEPTQVSGYASGANYHPNGALAGYTLANGVVHATTQNVRGLPEWWIDGGVMQDRYSYDENGNVLGIADAQEGVSSRSMGYDGLDRLTSASGIWGNAAYGYDAVDNLRSSTVGTRSYEHQIDPATNRLRALNSLNGNAPSLNLDYDANGNLRQRGSAGFVFDQGNRLRFATGKAAYGYDGHGRRWWTGFTSPATPGAYPTYNFSVYSRSGKLAFELHSTKGSSWPIYLGNQLIAEVRRSPAGASTTEFVHTDALGSPVARTSPQGSLLSRTRYEPYGGTAAGTNPTGIGFTGHVNDADTGLVYMQQRYYDPVAGRFLSVDPVVTDANNGVAFGRYDYATSNPYRYYDPDGKVSAAFGEGCTREDTNCVSEVGQSGEWTRVSRASAAAVATQGSPAISSPAVAGNGLKLTGSLGWIGRLLGGVGLMAYSGSAGEDSDKVTLFRAIGIAELVDIKATGTFNPAPNGSEMKQFWMNLKDAEGFGSSMNSRFGYSEYAHIVSVAVSVSTFGLGTPGYEPINGGQRYLTYDFSSMMSVNRDALRNGIKVKR